MSLIQARTSRHYHTWWFDFLFLTLVIGILFFFSLGARPLFVPDEGRYAEIIREMANHGDYVTPTLNGIKYFEKPILFYWLGLAAVKTAGISVGTIRSVNAIIGILGCLLTYFTARILYDRRTGLLSALILATCALYFVMSHMISLDLPVTVFIAATLYAFLLGIHHPVGRARRLYLWSAAVAAGLAVLTKGLIGIVFPVLIIGSWIALLGEWRLLKQLYVPSALCIFLLVVLPWHLLVQQRNPEFFYFYFIEQQFLRYTQRNIGHYQPIWFFIPNLIIGFFPWIIFLPQAFTNAIKLIWRNRHFYQKELFFLLWTTLIFIFFSLSKSKLIPYILPIFPALAILTARYLVQTSRLTLGIRSAYIALLLLALLIAGVFNIYPRRAFLPDNQTATHYLLWASSILLIGTVFSYFLVRRNLMKAVSMTILTSWLFLLITFSAMPAIDTRTIKPLAEVLNPILLPQDEVITYHQYYQDLPFYLSRRVTIVNWQNELSFGMKHQETRDWMINDETFLNRWQSKKRIFVIMSLDEYQLFQKNYPNERVRLLRRSFNNVLLSNQ